MAADRAYLPGARLGTGLASVETEVARLLTRFAQAGAERVEPPALLPADTLLDLYGEDIRARAYVTDDPVEGERMLRPDFTVPVVEMHASHGATPARYTYAGPVWRQQVPGAGRPTEYLQVGFELFDTAAAADADAEVFALLADAVGDEATVETGDIGLLLAAIDALSLDERRRAMLRHHVWRPARFRRLIERFRAPGRLADRLAALPDTAVAEHVRSLSPEIGVRSVDEITDRLHALREEAEAAPLPDADVALLDALLTLDGPMGEVLGRLRPLAESRPPLAAAVERLGKRVEALGRRGIDAAALPFATNFGRTAMEYYDGFVFAFTAPGRPDLPPLAQGGRYDALTAELGPAIPAVGGIVRPEALLAARS
ncbi:ATP phosphoribosyltransferase regulatory subunit [Pontivivens ytuae]|uniref:ATP phosphoribosyltransferase regulatory subunit n=1 Tax=Pontivivens ytuae TaxID=2789856 RepID=A0A7S9QEZ2_9RHOB|nr:ATP phosphoribosyltransferase regulatory subunit [Pontivivens ytuae]QPH55716.1 ATP phosphoribosyltransferase regulatory subunit [Pontivivens ytuae]